MTELLQPTILATSSTYLVYTISAYINLLPTRAAEVQFTYYCCILGLISVIVFYSRYITSESFHSKLNIVYVCVLGLLIVSYITHWFIPPDLTASQNNSKIVRSISSYDYEIETNSMLDSTRAIEDKCRSFDKKKCSHESHLVLQVAFMICILTSLITSLVW